MTNEKEFKIMGIRRSGNHAITSWIFDHYPGKVVYLNDIRKDLFDSPYYSFAQVNMKGLPFYQCKPKALSYVKHFLEKKHRFVREDKKLDLKYMRNFKSKDLLMHSYEDYALDDVYFHFLNKNHDEWMGISKTQLTILIIRDPFNMISSLLRSRKIHFNEIDKYLGLHKNYLREYLGITNKLENENFLFINYNNWCVHSKYRSEIIEKLGLQCTEESYNKVASEGGGSSFNGYGKNVEAKDLHVFDRYKHYLNNPKYFQSFAKDKELLELASNSFGKLAPEFYP